MVDTIIQLWLLRPTPTSSDTHPYIVTDICSTQGNGESLVLCSVNESIGHILLPDAIRGWALVNH